MIVELRLIRSRWITRTVQLPTPTNNFTLIIEFDDNPPAGPDDYIVDIHFTFESSQSSAELDQCREDLEAAQQQIEALTEELNTVREQLGVSPESPISDVILAIQQLQSQVTAANMTIEGLEHHLQEIFRDPE
ncbi:MAG: hypothetical protein HY731_11155, partial [Candidatus Tectomicrobia bacterium]|nr:hypothetical protein [Candidatus Tectomicrobia bacterium]